MGVEIERKFLVDEEKWKSSKPSNGQSILQGYLLRSADKTVRVRIKENQGYLTLKGKTTGASRPEFEYEIPVSEAREMLDTFCDQYIDKVRYEVKIDGKVWEVDEFNSPRKGLILAEIELQSEEEDITLPDWIEDEVTGDPQYYNANMLT